MQWFEKKVIDGEEKLPWIDKKIFADFKLESDFEKKSKKSENGFSKKNKRNTETVFIQEMDKLRFSIGLPCYEYLPNENQEKETFESQCVSNMRVPLKEGKQFNNLEIYEKDLTLFEKNDMNKETLPPTNSFKWENPPTFTVPKTQENKEIKQELQKEITQLNFNYEYAKEKFFGDSPFKFSYITPRSSTASQVSDSENFINEKNIEAPKEYSLSENLKTENSDSNEKEHHVFTSSKKEYKGSMFGKKFYKKDFDISPQEPWQNNSEKYFPKFSERNDTSKKSQNVLDYSQNPFRKDLIEKKYLSKDSSYAKDRFSKILEPKEKTISSKPLQSKNKNSFFDKNFSKKEFIKQFQEPSSAKDLFKSPAEVSRRFHNVKDSLNSERNEHRNNPFRKELLEKKYNLNLGSKVKDYYNKNSDKINKENNKNSLKNFSQARKRQVTFSEPKKTGSEKSVLNLDFSKADSLLKRSMLSQQPQKSLSEKKKLQAHLEHDLSKYRVVSNKQENKKDVSSLKSFRDDAETDKNIVRPLRQESWESRLVDKENLKSNEQVNFEKKEIAENSVSKTWQKNQHPLQAFNSQEITQEISFDEEEQMRKAQREELAFIDSIFSDYEDINDAKEIKKKVSIPLALAKNKNELELKKKLFTDVKKEDDIEQEKKIEIKFSESKSETKQSIQNENLELQKKAFDEKDLESKVDMQELQNFEKDKEKFFKSDAKARESVNLTEKNLTSESLPDESLKDFSSKIANEENQFLKKISETKKKTSETNSERASITPIVNFNRQYFLKLNSLKKSKNKFVGDTKEVQEVILKLEETLNQFNIEGRVVGIQQGPIITRYEIKIPPGIKVSRLLGLTDELAMALEAFKVRIEAPIPGRSTAGIEIPNKERQTVFLGDIVSDESFSESHANLPLPFGKDIAGNNVIEDLVNMPHLLIAGATGSGKSVAVNAFITSLILNKTPEEVRFLLVDPKLVELSHYNEIPHLLHPVITDHQKAILALNWAVEEMERRYEDLVDMRVRDIRSYNEKVVENNSTLMPYIVILIDELGDLMMVAGKDVENSIIRLTQKARAVGIHLILATQRPSVDVITALIKANCPARISLQVAQKTDSRTILDGNGAEQLLGKGDMLFRHPSKGQLQRIQCPYVEDSEVEEIVKQAKALGKPNYIALDDPKAATAAGDPEDEALMDEAWEIITESQKASASYLQRRLRIGYNRAARIIEAFEARGWIGPQTGSKPRVIFAKT